MDSHIERNGLPAVPCMREKAVLVPFEVFSLKISTAGALVLPLNHDRRLCVVLELVPLRDEKGHGQKNSF